VLVAAIVGLPRLADPCTVVFSGFLDDSLEGARPILRAGVEAPEVVSARLETPGESSSGCGGSESDCSVPFVELVVEGDGFELLAEDLDTGETIYHRPVFDDGRRKRYSPLRPPRECGAVLELAALFRDTEPAERSPQIRLRCEDIEGLSCPAC